MQQIRGSCEILSRHGMMVGWRPVVRIESVEKVESTCSVGINWGRHRVPLDCNAILKREKGCG